jgi:hypothetical protein
MKPTSFALLALLFCATHVFSQGEKTETEESAPPPTSARVLGVLPDGTPPAETPKPEFIVPAKDILETEIHQQGGRDVTIQKIKPIDLPPPPQPALPAAEITPEVQARIDAYIAAHPQDPIIQLGATVYRSKTSPSRSWVTFWPGRGEKPVTFWSSADFSLLSGLAFFVDSKGATRSLWMMWTVFDGTDPSEFESKEGRSDPSQAMPELPAGKATFAITSGNPSAQILATIQSFHDLYHNEHDKLKAAYDSREQVRIAREAQLKANPPKPKDITLNYWEIGTATPAKGGDK